jgi:drug/metabolite transporter (DMT)-like permease
MATENPETSSDSMTPPSQVTESLKSRSVMIARIVGILCVAGGFMLGIQALDHPASPMLPTALGMIVTGLVAQVFALARSWYLYSQRTV